LFNEGEGDGVAYYSIVQQGNERILTIDPITPPGEDLSFSYVGNTSISLTGPFILPFCEEELTIIEGTE